MIPMAPAMAAELLAAYENALKVDIYAAVAVERRLDAFGWHPADIRAGLEAASKGGDPGAAMDESHMRRTGRPREVEVA